MNPCSPASDFCDHSITESVNGSNGVSRPRVVSYHADDAFRYLGSSVLNALSGSLPVLLKLVGVVVRIRPKKQMIGVNARRNVAPVANKHSFGNGAMRYFIGRPVSLLCLTPECKYSVSSKMGVPSPNNATVLFVQRREGKPLFERAARRGSWSVWHTRNDAMSLNDVQLGMAA